MVMEQHPLSQELQAAIRKEVVQKTATYSVAAFIGFLAIAGTGWMLYLKDRVPNWVNGVPKGAVMAFDSSDGCPEGWKTFEDASGRFIVGAGQGKNLSERTLRSIGGKEEHKLTISELPPNEIQIGNLAAASRVDRYDAGGKDYWVVSVTSGKFNVGGNGNAIPTLPPFIALHYCKKG